MCFVMCETQMPLNWTLMCTPWGLSNIKVGIGTVVCMSPKDCAKGLGNKNKNTITIPSKRGVL